MTGLCQHHHLGFCVSGVHGVETSEGLHSTIRANDTYTIPPGHDEWVVGPEPFVAVEFLGAASFGRGGAQRHGFARPPDLMVGWFVVWQGTDAHSTKS